MSQELEGMSETDSLDKDVEQSKDQACAQASNKASGEMTKVVGVRFRHSKTLWFDPNGLEPKVGDKVITSTERGTEMGDCVLACWEVKESELPAPLKPVLRIAGDEDICRDKELQDEELAAMPVFRDYIEKNKIDMKPADVEILFGREKMIFYFSSEERIDFRQLVRDLAAHFHRRIEMRQVGVRDEARMTGGLGHCGEVLCCARLGGEFEPVSIKMAKEQGLPLNPSKISGVCGRLMCCLRYEVEAYKDFNNRSPKKGAFIDTPRGRGKVVERDALRESVKLQFRNDDPDKPGETMMVPLARMCCKDRRRGGKGGGKGDGQGCGGRPCAITPDDFAQLEEDARQARSATLSTEGLNYMGLDSNRAAGSAVDNGEQSSRGSRRGGRKGDKDASDGAEKQQSSGGGRKRSRRGKGRKRGPNDGSQGQKNQASGQDSQGNQNDKGGKAKQGQKQENRRGQRRRKSGGKNSKQQGQQGHQSGKSSNGQARQQGKVQDGKQSGGQQRKDTASTAETRVPRRRHRSSGPHS